jgi:hypothetical protein
MTLIGSVTVGTAAASVSFDNIPATYNQIVIVGTKLTCEDFAQRSLHIRFNNSSSNEYAYSFFGIGTTTSISVSRSTAFTSQIFVSNVLGANTEEAEGWFYGTVVSYTGSDHKLLKLDSARYTGSGTAYTGRMETLRTGWGSWNGTASISRIDFVSASGTAAGEGIGVGSEFYVYGI